MTVSNVAKHANVHYTGCITPFIEHNTLHKALYVESDLFKLVESENVGINYTDFFFFK